ncbi:transcriptional regulator [Parasphingopyxis algicola]|uniref:winged helix-turn-helix domain-containing protein n=1 Tax=Parasphingopyxis algicola TaxID=2026624 RepID=UPI0015A235C5|nr:winged helix-turn-helix domain-containing protein [Parasphingopyxis algicola]QLC25356.1 transcriptional regulator [Parasphingopyxis algicola]
MIYWFEGLELDPGRFELRRRGVPVLIQPQALDLLFLLVERHPNLVTKDEIVDHIWQGRAISDSALSSQIKALRKILGDDGRDQRFIQTVYGKGFRFAADVSTQSPAVAGAGNSGPEADGRPDGPVDETPTIAVLPFRLVRADSPHANIAQALPDELITALSRLRWLRVISRGSSFRFPSMSADLAQVGDQLNARYCVSGSVDIRDDAVVVLVELADTREETVVWAERFDTGLGGIHEIRQHIVASVLSSVEIQISSHEAERARLLVPEKLTAWQAYHLGVSRMFLRGKANNEAARRYFEQALAGDRDFARALAGVSHTHWLQIIETTWDGVGDAAERMLETAEAAIASDPFDPFANLARGRAASLVEDSSESVIWLERSIAHCPNYSTAHSALATMHALGDEGEQALHHVDIAIALSPHDPLLHSMYATKAIALFACGQIDEAAQWGIKAMELPHSDLMVMVGSLCTVFAGGYREEADRIAGHIKRAYPHATAEGIARANPMMALERRDAMMGLLSAVGFD